MSKHIHEEIVLLDKEIKRIEEDINRLIVLKYRRDFLSQFRDCVKSVGGDPDSFGMDSTLNDLYSTLAQNGFTFTTIDIEE